MRCLYFSLVFALLGSFALADDAPFDALHARYRSDELVVSGADVISWKNSASSRSGNQEGTVAIAKRDLNRIVGRPRAFRVMTAGGERTVLRLDGNSALWQAFSDWGSLADGRTVVVFARLADKAEGFLFDGSTNSGLTRAQVRAGRWQVGVQSPPISNASNADADAHLAEFRKWGIHAFVFDRNENATRASHVRFTETKAERKELDSKAAPPLSGFIVGTNAATTLGLECDVGEILVFHRALSNDELVTIAKTMRERWGDPSDLPDSKQPKPIEVASDPRVFRKILRQPGDDGSKAYRIPGLATTSHGTLVAVFDIRHTGGGDLPADIDVGMMRSTDDGETWSPMKRILDFDKDEPNSRGNGVGDPSILVDLQTKTILVAALWSKGNRAWNGSGPGLTPEETGQFVLTKSSDDGLTWSSPINITSQVKARGWRLCFNGPGAGIQTRDGCLVFPAQFRDTDATAHSCFIISRDHGETWSISPPAIPGARPTSESQIVELDDGSLLLSMRDESRNGKRAWAKWSRADTKNEPQTKGSGLSGHWSESWFTVPDPTCMASLVRHPHGELIFSNPNSSSRRIALTLRTSTDQGQTWSAGRLLDHRDSMYSCLTILKDHRIGVLYETAGTLTFARFPLDWITEVP